MQPITNSRRDFIRTASLVTAASLLPVTDVFAKAKPKAAAPTLPHTDAVQIPLPFEIGALDPVISAKTVEVHYGKHHKTYADKMQAALKDSPLAGRSLEDIITVAAKDTAKPGLFNMAAQVWNHNFYWQSLNPRPNAPTGKLLGAIEKDFGSLEACKKALTDASVGQFGSGWGWLVLDHGKLKVVSTSNADLPFLHGQLPLLNIDVWEHAYYLDYQNKRADHVAAVIEKTLNWDFAAKNFDAA